MLNKLRERRDNESGFTLIELLVVILIIGILAAIALPAFLGQRAKGQDSSAKSDARNTVSQLESCYATAQTYENCSLTNSGLSVGTSGGQVQVTSPSSTGYTITAYSKSNNRFIITKTGSTTERSCNTNNSGTADGGCNGGSW